MDELTPEMQRLFAAKENRRQRLARASFPEKIAALVRLQALAAPIQRQRGRTVKPWLFQMTMESLLLNETPPPYGTPKPKN
ncbi:MAG: hypothetical protein PHC88_07340 [Terrimicrobiaceae bacterium]|nr:hypothetical protein [Terrimicrobiaceae bacterium]